MDDNGVDFIPLKYLENSLRYWWFVVLIALVGGMIGYIIHISQAPEYEARAIISVGIDFARTGYLSDIEEDQIIGMVGDVISSSDVMNQVDVIARQEGLLLDNQSAKEFLRAERWGFRWAVRAKHIHPETAASLSNLWAGIAMNVLEESNKHAILAEGIDRYLLSLESCLQTQVSVNPVHGQCPFQNREDLQNEMAGSIDELIEQRSLSNGISPSIQLVLSENAKTPQKPIRFGKNSMIFSSAMLGFFLGVVLVEINLPGKFHQGV